MAKELEVLEKGPKVEIHIDLLRITFKKYHIRKRQAMMDSGSRNSPIFMCDTVGGIRFCGCLCGCQSEDLFFCFGAKPTQRVCTQDFPRDRKKTREGKSQTRTEEQGSRQNKAVSRREQSTEVGGSRWSEKGYCKDLWTQRPGWPTGEDE